MALDIKVLGDDDTEEGRAGKHLKSLFQKELNSANGHILIKCNAKLIGSNVKDIDIVVMGNFEPPCEIVLSTTLGNDDLPALRKVSIGSFCYTIEVKSHSVEAVSVLGEKLYVQYNGKDHDASEQNHNQKSALLNFLKARTDRAPFICNFIWLVNVSRSELVTLIGERAELTSTHNFLSSNLAIKGLFQLAMRQRSVLKANTGKYYSSAVSQPEAAQTLDSLEKSFSVFEQFRKGVGRLSRQQMERATSKILGDQKYAQAIGQKLVIFSGRAGTGKTLKLLRVAFDLAEKDSRVLILTFNHALVSDIKRLLHLSDIGDGIEQGTVDIRTLDKFFLGLLNATSKEKVPGTNFFTEREKYLSELLEYAKEGLIDKSDIAKAFESKAAWDYVLIEEAQDWQPTALFMWKYVKSSS